MKKCLIIVALTLITVVFMLPNIGMCEEKSDQKEKPVTVVEEETH